jgi:hypothetical protein
MRCSSAMALLDLGVGAGFRLADSGVALHLGGAGHAEAFQVTLD